ncbi:DUF1194 domain-containing protein [Pseudooceanicola sediminis]|uniref:DUF1194 domain-containing protein n=1 Tax=Pseudooceanicola sediminis TaxID=2211117 RepID=A0A399J5X6_9RHOB|nr:DUF1194 domain-containing protein [Pseudooceanicola sediminis]KAA2314153.1 DUF1194 domain-containing protein [Puniceibacterium sp. HSS470]RII39987.1 DUF1194 domain-containing protein [Pseudooceanicola sediminis]|tara:strand:- start:48245 stop:49054 length:810 start_codon:yes stop_codon:yes gene_type:complete
MLRVIAVALMLAALTAGGARAETCRQALALGLDVSGSVDDTEYRLQLDGLAAALANPQVREALLQMPETPVRLMVYEWSGPQDQRVLSPWTVIGDAAALETVRQRLRAVGRVHMEPSTAIGAAMRFGAGALARQDGCWRRVLDVSGDGMHNAGPHPREIDMGALTVNGLVIGEANDASGGIAQLMAYYRAYVLRGPDAFAEAALGFRDFEAAMVRKLLKELEVPSLAQSGPGPDAWRDARTGPAGQPRQGWAGPVRGQEQRPSRLVVAR